VVPGEGASLAFRDVAVIPEVEGL